MNICESVRFAIAIQPGPTTDVHGHEEKRIYNIYTQSQRAPLGSRAPGPQVAHMVDPVAS